MPRRSTADERIRAYVARQRLGDQAQLPPERELAALLEVSRGQLRTGLAKLKAHGLVWGRVGKGTFIGQQPPLDPRGLVQLTLLTNPRDIMEARFAIEPMLASLAALRASPAERLLLEKCILKTRTAADRATFQRWDEEFHQTVARAARNPLLHALFDAVNESRRRDVWTGKRNQPLPAPRRKAYIAQHAACFSAIASRDAAKAALAMRQHLEYVASVCDVFGSGLPTPVEKRRAPAPAPMFRAPALELPVS